MSEAPPSQVSRRGWLTRRRLAVVLGVWVVAAGGALLLANALDDPVGEGARDEAQAVAPGQVAVPGFGAERQGPLTLVLDAPLPDELLALPPVRRAARLTELARSDPDPRWLLALGSTLQELGNAEGATIVYRALLGRDPASVAARAGLAVVEGAGGGPGLARAAAGLERLARENPDSQLVAFNQGVVEVYRERAAAAAAAWSRTVELDPDTYLGQAAADGLAQIARATEGGTP